MPKVKTLQIVWHEKEPVFSLDFHPDGTLLTAGADKEIKQWEVGRDKHGYAEVKHVSSLVGHEKTVNCVRVSPAGDHLASSGDGGEVFLWQPQAPSGPRGNLISEEESSACWKRDMMLRGHGEDVMDVAWSSDGTALVTGSVENKACVWDVAGKKRGQMVAHFNSHKHFVQGVAWDPAQQFVVTQSADRTVRVFTHRPLPAARRNKVNQYMQPACDIAKELYCAQVLNKRAMTLPETANDAAAAPDTNNNTSAKPSRHPLFLDEVSLPSFFRRPAWSPDGSFVVLPAGSHRAAPGAREVHTAYIFARGQWTTPVAHLPAQTKAVVAVRFCPVLFQLPSDATPPPTFASLPYKMVFAVATVDSVVLYDTTSVLPLAVLGQLHYETITDLSWSRDGQYLAVSSMDCYCSIAAFAPGELGQPMPVEELPQHIVKRLPVATQMKASAQPETATVDAVALPPAVAPPVTEAAVKQVAVKKVNPPAYADVAKPAVAAPVAQPAKKRIVAETVGPVASSAQNASSAADQPAVKKAKRITPALVQPLPSGASLATQQPQQGSSAAMTATEKHGEKDKGPKRITPTPLASQVREQFENPKQAPTPAAPRSCDPPAASAGGASHRRITPVPVASKPVDSAAEPAAKPSGGFSIAAMALAAGRQAAEANAAEKK